MALDLLEIQNINSTYVISHKVRSAYEIVKKPVLVDDTALYIETWNQLPGALIA